MSAEERAQIPLWLRVATLTVAAAVLAPILLGEPFAADLALDAPFAADPLGRFEPLARAVRELVGPARVAWVALLVLLGSTALVIALARRLGLGALAAVAAALVFALHPAQVTPLARGAWLGALLATLASLLALRAHLERRAAGRPAWNLAAGAWTLVGLCAGEHALAVPLIAFALERATPQEPHSPSAPAARTWLPYAGALGAWWAARAIVFGELGGGLARRVLDYGVAPARMLWLRVEVLGGSLERLVWPFDHDPWPVFAPSPQAFESGTWLPFAVLALWLGALALARRHRGALFAGLALAPLALLPFALRLRTLGAAPVSDRLLPLAAAGFALAAVGACERFLPRAAARMAQAALVVALTFAAHARIPTQASEQLWLERVVARHPEAPEPLWRLGRLRLERFRTAGELTALAGAFECFQGALDTLERTQSGERGLLATREDHVQANLGLAWSLWYEARIDPYHDWQLPETLFETIAEHYPEVGEARIGLALSRVAAGDLDGAENALRAELERDPANAEARHLLGQVALRRADFAAAVEEFRRALALRPGHLDDQTWLARALAESGRPDEARALLATARAEHPESAEPLVIEGILDGAAGDIQRARELAIEATELDPRDADAWLLKGKLHALAGEPASALTGFQRACELDALSFEAHHQTAALLLATRGLEEARPYLLRAYRLRPAGELGELLRETLLQLQIGDVGSLLELASADLQRRSFAEALEWIELALAVAPERQQVHVLHGRILEEQNERELAVDAFRRACELDEDALDAHYRLGMLLVGLGRREEARYYLERAVVLARRAPLAPPVREGIEQSARRALDER